MYCTRKVNDDYTWVGADCRRLALFEGVFGVPDGISFNSYLLTDEKTVLFDGVDSVVRRTFRENLAHALAGRELDYIVVHHMEPDHAAELADLAKDYPKAQFMCSAMAKTMVGQFFGPEVAGRITVIKEGDTLCTGRHTLRFVAAPMVHWPEVMVSYDTATKTLYSADAFGTFGALNGNLYADEVNFRTEWLAEARRYYTNIVGKYGPQVQTVLQKAGTLDIQMLLPLHGFVWRKALGYFLEKYDLWSRYEPEVRGVMIAYASVYGDTENAANVLACRLAERGVKVTMFDASVTPASYIVSAAFRYSHLVFASTTYNMGIFVTMEQLLHDIVAHQLANRRYALIENGSWSPVSGKKMQELLTPLKGWSEIQTPLTVKSALRPDQDAQMERLADAIAADVREEKTEQAASGEAKHRYVCKVCGYVYEGDTLPEDYKCPLCGAGAAYFQEEA